jgi:outer membrane protein, multidrug efflux system
MKTEKNLKKMSKFLKLLTALFLISACTLEPKYKKPEPKITLLESETNQPKISTISWQNFFQSPQLHKLIESALKNNRDLQVASLNIEAAQANYGITKSNLLPSINGVASKTEQGVPSAFSRFTANRQYRANLSLASYELDFFGRLRSLKKSALEDFLATKQANEVAKISVITQTVNAYAQYLLDRELLEIAKEVIDSEKEKYHFTEIRYENDLASKTDLLNAEAQIESKKIAFEEYKKQVELDKTALKILSGNFDEEILRDDLGLEDLQLNESALNFIASDSLLNRPDIQQAEHNLKNANANIGAARAAFFPSISISGSYGYSSTQLNGLFESKTWSYTPQINLPIFAGGRNYQNLKLANIRKKIEITEYEQVIEKAFRETLDELAQREALIGKNESAEKILKARQKNYELSQAKQKNGINSKSQLIDDKITFLAAHENYLIMKKDYLVNLVNLYKVLGGGSETDL